MSTSAGAGTGAAASARTGGAIVGGPSRPGGPGPPGPGRGDQPGPGQMEPGRKSRAKTVALAAEISRIFTSTLKRTAREIAKVLRSCCFSVEAHKHNIVVTSSLFHRPETA